MILLIDAGNSRLKWGLWQAGDWYARGAFASNMIADAALRDRCLDDWRAASWIGVACVAGESVRGALRDWLDRLPAPQNWLAAEVECGGLRNGYRDPATLGADRWANLLACHGLGLAPCVVASVGTAITVDALDAEGRFLGGLILPGPRLMWQALRAGTAGVIPPAAGVPTEAPADLPGTVGDFPDATADAVLSGIVAAGVGAIEGQRHRLAGRVGGPVGVVLTGGDAGLLAPHLAGAVTVMDDLTLRGLVVFAERRGVV